MAGIEVSLPLHTYNSVFTGSCRKARPNSLKGEGNDMDIYIGLDVSLASS